MKYINQFITEYIIKKRLDKAIDSEDHYEYFPETKEELIENIKELLNKGETDLNCIDTSAITDMSNLFKYINYLFENINISNWNVSNVTNMNYMFYNCCKFDCDLSKWNVSNVKDMKYMFINCYNFKGKGLENWDVSNVENMCGMLDGCKYFNCDLSNWDVSNVENMEYMFYDCKKLNCNLFKWNTSKVIDMKGMFFNCDSLKNKPSWYKE